MNRSIVHMMKRVTLNSLLAALLAGSVSVHAGETENHGTRVLPAPGKVEVDGAIGDWDLSGGTFACMDVERYREHYAVWLHLMYDAENLYVLARWSDPTPLDNPQSSRGGYGFKGDCLQVRMAFNYEKPGERVSHLTAWQDKDGLLVADLAYGRNFNEGNVPNITGAGGRHAVATVKDSPAAYTQEIAIPWKLIAPEGWTPKAGESFKATVEPNFTADKIGRITTKDLLYNPAGVPDRIFTFQSARDWALATLVKDAPVTPQPLVMASGDEFKVSMKDGTPIIDWSPLFVKKELPGHKDITFTLPYDGRVSLVIKNKAGAIVRHLLNDVLYPQGTHTVKWDGLATPMWRTPTDVIPAGDYTWEAIVHKPYKLVLQGWVDCHGIPWETGKNASWGGDHGAPYAVTAYKDTMILGWDGSEAGHGVIAVTKKGTKLWHPAKGPTAGHPFRLVVDGDEVIGFDKNIWKFRATDGEFGEFTRNGMAFVYSKDLLGDAKAPKGEAFVSSNDSLDACEGVIYLGFSDVMIAEDHITDWKKIAVFLQGDTPLAQELLAIAASTTEERNLNEFKRHLKDFLEGKRELKDTGPNWSRFSALPAKLSRSVLDRTDLFPGSKGLAGVALRTANREWLSAQMGGAFKPLRKDFILMVEKDSGSVLGYVDVPAPTFIHAVSKDLLYVISDEREVLAVNPATGKYKSLTRGEDFKAMTLDGEGNLVIAQAAPANQVVVFNTEGKELRRIGMKGGRPALGPWQKDGLLNPIDLCFDSDGRLWVMENDRSPKRVSVWDYAAGKNVDEFFGPTHYGASGACINPVDPNIMISSGVEYRLDEKGRGHAQQVISLHNESTFSTYATPANGRLYWVRAQMQPQAIEIFEKIKDGSYVLRADITAKVEAKSATTCFWSDANGDGKRDATEIKSIPTSLEMTGMWHLAMDARHLTITAKDRASGSNEAIMKAYKVTSYTACGAPVWDVENPQDLSYTHIIGGDGKKTATSYQFGHMMPSLDNKTLLSHHSGDKQGGTREMLECFDMVSGKRLWWYPKQWNHVHGGHHAPPPEPGLFRAAYGIIGQFVHPVVGNVWVITTDKGEWHMISETGFYVGNLFNPDPMSVKFPDQAVIGADMTMSPPGSGGEDFGGSVIQSTDGTVHIQSGKVGAWKLGLEGLDSIQRIGTGKVTLKPAEIALAEKEYERQKQDAIGQMMMEIEKKSIAFTGDIGRDFGGKPLEYKKGENTRVRTYAAYDDSKLYLGYEVYDPTPWINGAGEAVALYQGGDTVDLQIGTDPTANRKRSEAVKGDLRLSIGNFKGTPAAVLYRKVWDRKSPREFTSGVIKSYLMDYVAVLDSAEIKVTVDNAKKMYIVEAAIPFADLGLTPDKTALYKADFGVTHGDPAGQRTQLRTHWSNQETGLVNDAVYELMMSPQNWGEVTFK